MKNFSIENNDILVDYIVDLFQPTDAVLKSARQRAAAAGLPDIHVHDMDGRHLQVLSMIVRPKKILEIGTLAGVSGICLLRGAAPDGFLHTLEINPDNAAIAEKNLVSAGLSGRFKIHVGSAKISLPSMQEHGPFDLVFIDADKVSYPQYLTWAIPNVRPGGVIIGDNTFAFGRLAPGTETKGTDGLSSVDAPGVDALREFNQMMASDKRLVSTILPTGEGLTIGVRV